MNANASSIYPYHGSPAHTPGGEFAPHAGCGELNLRHTARSPNPSDDLTNLAQRHRFRAAWEASFEYPLELAAHPRIAPPRKKSGGVSPVALAVLLVPAALVLGLVAVVVLAVAK
jgi:hypothetical protein